jgi:hypothetical protein
VDFISGLDFQVFIISYKRAGAITSDKVFNNAYIVIPKSQEEDYRKYEPYENGCELLVIPDEADGNIVKKRNWILNNYEGKNVVIVDDDYDYIGYHENFETNIKMSPDEIDVMLERGFIMAKDLGTPMWGINVNTDPIAYMQYTPFNMLSPILGPFQAFTDELPAFIRYDEYLYLKEDYDISLQVMHKYHKVLRFNKYHYSVNHINKKGGVVSYRTQDKENRHNERLQKKWGRKVVKLRNDSINPVVKCPLSGV